MSTSSAEAPGVPDEPRSWIRKIAGALTHRNFRLVWLAALGSTIGTWMQKFAQSLLVYDLTGSTFFLGMDDFINQVPILLLMLIGGVIADRHDRRLLLTGSQYIQAFSAFMLALLVWLGHVNVWMIFALSFISGCGQAFGGPAYQSLIPSLVPKRDLPNAIALNSTQFNLSRILGPAGGVAIVTTVGTAWCFAFNGLSFFFVVLALAALHLPKHVSSTAPRDLKAELKGGLTYVGDNRLMLTLTVLVAISTFLTMPIITMLPAFAKEVLAGEGMTAETRLFALMACQGFGAILGALIVGLLDTSKGMGRLLLGVQIALGLLIASFAQSTSLVLSLVLLCAGGILFMLLFSISFSLVQLTVPDGLRGRVVSIYMVALRGGGPLGGLVAGALADLYSVQVVMAISGVLLALMAGSIFLFRRHGTLARI